MGNQGLYLEFLTIGLLFFGLVYFFFTSLLHFKKRLAVSISMIILILAGIGFYTYYLETTPTLVKVSPGNNETGAALNRKIEIEFDRPVSRPMLAITLSPQIPGKWIYSRGLIPNHLMRRLTFVPTETLPPDTEFTVNLKGIQNVRRTSMSTDYDFQFKTQESPRVSKTVPGNNEKSVRPDTKIEVYLTAPNGSLSQINFDLVPHVPFAVKEDVTRTHLTITPKEPLSQGTRYQLRVTKSDLRRDLATNEVVRTGIENLIYTDNFTIREAAGIDSFMPSGNKVTSKQPVTIRFSRPMVEAEVAHNFSITPPVEGSSLFIDSIIYVFTPKKYAFNTTYTVKLAKGTHALDGSFLPDDAVHSFSTLGNVLVDKITPRDMTEGADVRSPIKIFFDQDVVAETSVARFSISPKVDGRITWEGTVLTFTPNRPLSYSTTYTVKMGRGVRGTDGLDSVSDFSASFVTEPESVVLAVPVFLQQHSLSCEAAALRMALAFRKVQVTEDTLIGQIGFDATAHRGNTWGDPYQAFVGSIDGKQMSSGYGVYWGPITRVANLYRKSVEFSGWSAQKVLAEVKKGNLVILWTNTGGGEPVNWYTQKGEKIFAVAGEHSVVITGFVGAVDDPTQVIVNDPLEGRTYWNKETYEKKLATFVGSGVVIY